MLYNRELTLAPDLTFPSVRSIVAKSSAIWEQGRFFVANGWSELDGCWEEVLPQAHMEQVAT